MTLQQDIVIPANPGQMSAFLLGQTDANDYCTLQLDAPADLKHLIKKGSVMKIKSASAQNNANVSATCTDAFVIVNIPGISVFCESSAGDVTVGFFKQFASAYLTLNTAAPATPPATVPAAPPATPSAYNVSSIRTMQQSLETIATNGVSW